MKTGAVKERNSYAYLFGREYLLRINNKYLDAKFLFIYKTVITKGFYNLLSNLSTFSNNSFMFRMIDDRNFRLIVKSSLFPTISFE